MTVSRTQLGAFDIGCVVVGGIIGVGIFFTPAAVAARVDDANQVVLAWGLGGVIAVLGALVFARLSRIVHGHGGTFVYIHRAFGPLPAFVYGWSNWLVIQAGALGVIGLILADNLDLALFGRATTSEPAKVWIAAGAIALFTAVNALGLRVGKRVQNSLTVIKTSAVFLLVLIALVAPWLGEVPAADGATDAGAREPRGLVVALGAAMLPVLFAFGGWQQGSFVAGAARRPERDVAAGIVGGVLVVVAAYLTVNLAFLDVLGFEGAARSPSIGADAARTALEPAGLGELAGRGIAAMIVASACGILNTICLAPPFVLHAMAEQGLFLRGVGRIGATGTPVVAVLCQGVWGIALLLLVFLTAERDALFFLADGVVFVDWLFFALCGLALLRLDRQRGRAVPLAFTGCALLVVAGAIATMPWPAVSGFVISALGVPCCLIARRRARNPRRAREPGAAPR